MKHEIAHGLPVDVAKKAVTKAFDAYSQRFSEYKPTLDWASETKANVGFSIKGMSVKGSFEITPSKILLDLDVPFVFRIFKNQAVGVIDQEVSKWISKAKAGQLGD